MCSARGFTEHGRLLHQPTYMPQIQMLCMFHMQMRCLYQQLARPVHLTFQFFFIELAHSLVEHLPLQNPTAGTEDVVAMFSQGRVGDFSPVFPRQARFFCRSLIVGKAQALLLLALPQMNYKIKDGKNTNDILYTSIMALSLASCELTTSPAVTAQTTHE